MNILKDKNQCCAALEKPDGLFSSLRGRILSRLKDHVAECPKCQKRLALVNRVEIALMLIKSQPYKLDLLSRANQQALNVLSRSLRHTSKSDSLKTARSDKNRIEKIRPVFERLLNTAACLFIIVMIKTGISGSLTDYRKKGQTAIENYYARNLDRQTMDELFSADNSLNG